MGDPGVSSALLRSPNGSFDLNDDVVPETPSPIIAIKKRRYIGGSKLAEHQATGVLRSRLGSRAEPATKRLRHEALAQLQRRRRGVQYFSDSEDEFQSPEPQQQSVPDTDPESDSDLIPAPMDVDTPAVKKRCDFMSARQLLESSEEPSTSSPQPSTSTAAMLTPPPEGQASTSYSSTLDATPSPAPSPRSNGRLHNGALSLVPSPSPSPTWKSLSSPSSAERTSSLHKHKSHKSCKHHKSSHKSSSSSKHKCSKGHHSSSQKSCCKHRHSSSQSSSHTSPTKSPKSSPHKHSHSSSHRHHHKEHHHYRHKSKSSKSSSKHRDKSRSQQSSQPVAQATNGNSVDVDVVDLLDISSDDDSLYASPSSPRQNLHLSETSSDIEEEEWHQYMLTIRSPRKNSRRILSPEPEISSDDAVTSPTGSVSPPTEVTIDVETDEPLPSLSARIRNRRVGQVSQSQAQSSGSRQHRRTETGEAVAVVNQIDEDAAMARRLQEEMDRQYAASLAMQSDTPNREPAIELPPGDPISPPRRRSRNTGSRSRRVNSPRSRSPRFQDLDDRLSGHDPRILMAHRYADIPQDWPRLHAGFINPLAYFPYTRRLPPAPAHPPRPRSRRGRRVAVELAGGNDYEELLALGELLGDVQARPGLTPEQISLLPTHTFKKSQLREGEVAPSCNICMCDAEEGDTLRSLLCFHSFHKECIDQWIKDNPTCPVCRVGIEFS